MVDNEAAEGVERDVDDLAERIARPVEDSFEIVVKRHDVPITASHNAATRVHIHNVSFRTELLIESKSSVNSDCLPLSAKEENYAVPTKRRQHRQEARR